MTDHELLRAFAERASDDAFRQLVERHAGWVHGVALRRLGREELACEATHAVFIALARKAGALSASTLLNGWLFRAARFAAGKLLRDEERRARREREAARIMHEELMAPDDDNAVWEQIAPHVDGALAALSESDRNAVLLRFFNQRSFKDVGASLGVSEDAAKMRVGRALEKLRRLLAKRGVALSILVLTSAFAAPAAQAAQTLHAGLASSTFAAVSAKSAASTPLVEAILRALNWWRWKFVVIAGVTVLLLVVVSGWWWSEGWTRSAPAWPQTNAPAWPADPWLARR